MIIILLYLKIEGLKRCFATLLLRSIIIRISRLLFVVSFRISRVGFRFLVIGFLRNTSLSNISYQINLSLIK
jgi:hypothetical protein